MNLNYEFELLLNLNYFHYEFERFTQKYNNFTTLFAGQHKLRRVKFAEKIAVDARTFGRHVPFPERVKNLNVTGILIKFNEGDTNFLLFKFCKTYK